VLAYQSENRCHCFLPNYEKKNICVTKNGPFAKNSYAQTEPSLAQRLKAILKTQTCHATSWPKKETDWKVGTQATTFLKGNWLFRNSNPDMAETDERASCGSHGIDILKKEVGC
jgi:hypothetical protein